MGFRDFSFWANEARRKANARKTLAYSAALLPYQKPETIRREMESLQLREREFESEDAIDAAERENAELIPMARERKKMARTGKRRMTGPPPRVKKLIANIRREQ
jgi:hypothetical protein